MSIFLFNFKPRFAPKVESGAKRQTIRATRADGRAEARSVSGAPDTASATWRQRTGETIHRMAFRLVKGTADTAAYQRRSF